MALKLIDSAVADEKEKKQGSDGRTIVRDGVKLENLPEEVLSGILSYLPLDTLLPITLLSRSLHTLTASPTLSPLLPPLLHHLLQPPPYPQSLLHLPAYSHIPQKHLLSILLHASPAALLETIELPRLPDSVWEEAFNRRFLPSWRKVRQETGVTSWRAAFMRMIRRLLHRQLGFPQEEPWTRFVILHRNGTGSINRLYSRLFNPIADYNEIKRQNNLLLYPTSVRLIAQFQDFRLIAIGVLASPQSLFVNENAFLVVHPPGLSPSLPAHADDHEETADDGMPHQEQTKRVDIPKRQTKTRYLDPPEEPRRHSEDVIRVDANFNILPSSSYPPNTIPFTPPGLSKDKDKKSPLRKLSEAALHIRSTHPSTGNFGWGGGAGPIAASSSSSSGGFSDLARSKSADQGRSERLARPKLRLNGSTKEGLSVSAMKLMESSGVATSSSPGGSGGRFGMFRKEKSKGKMKDLSPTWAPSWDEDREGFTERPPAVPRRRTTDSVPTLDERLELDFDSDPIQPLPSLTSVPRRPPKPSPVSRPYKPLSHPTPAYSHRFYPNFTPTPSSAPNDVGSEIKSRDMRSEYPTSQAAGVLGLVPPAGDKGKGRAIDVDEGGGGEMPGRSDARLRKLVDVEVATTGESLSFVGPMMVVAQLWSPFAPISGAAEGVPGPGPNSAIFGGGGMVPGEVERGGQIELGPPGSYLSFEWEDLERCVGWLKWRKGEDGSGPVLREGLGFGS